MLLKKSGKEYIPIVVSAIAFVFMLLFYTHIHPVIIFDTDDWCYNSYTRHPVPLWKNWNPTRVLPEVFMPIVSRIGSLLVYPVTDDFIRANTFIHAFVVSLFIGFYVYSFYAFILLFTKNRNHIHAAYLTILFFVFHFLIFRSQPENNRYMFMANDQCVFYYYVIGNLLNSSLVLMFLRYRHPGNHEEKKFNVPWLIVAVYFALFSNLYASCILAVCIGIFLVWDFVITLKRKASLPEFLKSHALYFSVLSVWLFIQFFEANGGRATMLLEDVSLKSNLKKQIKHLLNLIKTVNRPFAVFACIVLIVTVIAFIRRFKELKEYLSYILLIGISSGVTFIYILLISSTHYLGSIVRPEISWGGWFFLFLCLFSCLGIVLTDIKKVSILLPLLCVLAILECNTTTNTYMENNFRNYPYETVYDVDRDIVEQIIEADDEHLDQVDVYIPNFASAANWPISTNDTSRVSHTLSDAGIIRRNITLNFIPTDDKNIELGLPVYD